MRNDTISALLKRALNYCAAACSATLLISATGIAIAYAAPPYLAGDDQKPVKPDISQRTQIRFLTGTDFPPFNSLSPQGRLSGYHIDLIRALCQELAITSRCLIEARPWNELLPALQKNEADVLIAGLTPDREKRTTLSFTRAYFSLPARFVTAKTSKLVDKNFSPDEQTVGVLAGSAHEALLKAYFPKAKSSPYSSSELLYKDLRDGKIPLLFGDAMSLSLWMNPTTTSGDNAAPDGSCCRFIGGTYPAPEFLGQGMTIALRKQDADLRLTFNNALNALERKGVLDDLYLRYFPVDFY
ncbi:transporter substrate-binding domain-containing protein [Ochrobactrum sp. SFR4]|uniref:transporter substrate-binding domain-containing protein n=1 Tax=Ochrobactrum sp. SFR4 TaxID=2717368 RepID=UPI001C8BEFAE|nr:transporter substrate-binding domain-containing protein [Ochrobactrum sp. SFR4]MBX8825842.1 transporter substrate-binding domain-containing protein [Ochrobactrum sp. SFR4]